MNVLLTGSTGFVGRHLVTKHSIFKHVVRTNDVNFLSSVYIVESLNAKTNWSNAFEGVDVIIHLAGLAHSDHHSTLHYQDVNVDGTLKLASEARKAGVQRFVFVSSIGVNGTSTQSEPFSVKCTPAPHNAYARSKYEAELGLKKIAEETGLEVVIVRPTLVYGPNAPGNFGMLTKLVRKLPVLPFGLAHNRRDFISVQNLADLLITCATHPKAAGHTFLASDGETVSIKQFTNAIAKGLGKKVFQLPVPVVLMRLAGKLTGKSAMIEQLYGNLEIDSSNIKEVLGWTPPYTMEQSMALLKHTDK
ncbi:3-beta hydroxysteroid dehydrogenase/isomerase family protein [Vibrio cholerae]|nr:putative epimerase [Vibrio cholerae]GHW45160.1 3-beta hydroxysteroid dehydrogenase/isomerase family protein [Vibrio cholerae]